MEINIGFENSQINLVKLIIAQNDREGNFK